MSDQEPKEVHQTPAELESPTRLIQVVLKEDGIPPDMVQAARLQNHRLNTLFVDLHKFETLTQSIPSAQDTLSKAEMDNLFNIQDVKIKAIRAIVDTLNTESRAHILEIEQNQPVPQEETGDETKVDSNTHIIEIDDPANLEYMLLAFDIVNHDFRTPVTALVSFSQLTQRRLAQGDIKRARESFEIVNREIKRFAPEIQDGKEIILNPLLKQTLKRADVVQTLSYKLRSDDRRIAIKVDPLPQFPGIEWNRVWFSSLLTNIKTNALKAYQLRATRQEYRRNEPKTLHVKIEIDQETQELVFIFEDQGPGFPETEINNIPRDGFRPGNSEWEGVAKGTGIGMYIHQKMLQEHFNGSIKAENIKGEDTSGQEITVGARVTVRVPLARIS